MSLIPSSFLDCVVAIGFPDAGGEAHYTATGFLYGYFEPRGAGQEGQYTVFLVTNRHVLDGGPTAVLRFNPRPGESAREFPAPLENADGTARWVGHQDPSVDVAVVPLNVHVLNENKIPISLFGDDKHVLFLDSAAAQRLSEGDGVFILGFPMGNVGDVRNYVIVRSGAIARIRDTLNGHAATFLVDAFIFPGNSGGPVVVKPEVVSIVGTEPIGSAYLIGMVSSYLPYQDVAVSQQTQRPRVIFEENSGLAVVIPADRIRDTVRLALGHDHGAKGEGT